MSFWQHGRHSIARLIGVDLTHTQIHYARMLERYVRPGSRWLEVGCGRQILPDWAMPISTQHELAARAKILIGIDVDAALHEHPLLTYRVVGLGNAMPFQSGSFDLVTANMVVEHVHKPKEFLLEVERILQPGGSFLFHTTNFQNIVVFMSYLLPDRVKEKLVWILEKRKAEDLFPTRFEMNTLATIKEVVAGTSLTIEHLATNGTSGFLGRLGALGWAELFLTKAVSSFGSGRYNSNLICVLRRS
jgi:2-polyprenyl-3-methyl-5-hydroxy-6-metoxy-1,4-benzoquinol methylase